MQTIKEMEKKKKSKRPNGENILIGHRVNLLEELGQLMGGGGGGSEKKNFYKLAKN